ncbi:hypothetical protein HSBAA_PA_3880 (plasmid) [Vreelandella sulfidaeris]|uniref:Uncharacterized protein n=1 Tax=Vreelandella sulfidaeris TaxID=115553 RepID=A0A455UI38_9GAMM|nr:hypothetical protein HSBAA_PA_0200 [Halomonas sulfidaeris]BBI65785.1 hypothetical protein HSBAA_PA_3880 [Halomonas sulfidaeris]
MPESTLGRLELYKELYQQTFGEKVANNDLVDLMLTNVMDRDREFKRFLREEERKKNWKQNNRNEAQELSPQLVKLKPNLTLRHKAISVSSTRHKGTRSRYAALG